MTGVQGMLWRGLSKARSPNHQNVSLVYWVPCEREAQTKWLSHPLSFLSRSITQMARLFHLICTNCAQPGHLCLVIPFPLPCSLLKQTRTVLPDPRTLARRQSCSRTLCSRTGWLFQLPDVFSSSLQHQSIALALCTLCSSERLC